MDLPGLEERIRVAEEHVALGRRHIVRQRQIIAELEADGHDSTRAHEILQTYEDLQRSHEDSLTRLRAVASTR